MNEEESETEKIQKINEIDYDILCKEQMERQEQKQQRKDENNS